MAQPSSHRQLLIFGNAGSQSLVQQQVSLLHKAAAGVKERDLTLVIVEKESSVYRKYKLEASPFTVLLIGKDGYEKYRTHTLFTTEHLFAIIDAMPMRKREMKEQKE